MSESFYFSEIKKKGLNKGNINQNYLRCIHTLIFLTVQI